MGCGVCCRFSFDGLLDFMCFRFSGLVIFWLVVAIHLSGVFWVCWFGVLRVVDCGEWCYGLMRSVLAFGLLLLFGVGCVLLFVF